MELNRFRMCFAPFCVLCVMCFWSKMSYVIQLEWSPLKENGTELCEGYLSMFQVDLRTNTCIKCIVCSWFSNSFTVWTHVANTSYFIHKANNHFNYFSCESIKPLVFWCFSAKSCLDMKYLLYNRHRPIKGRHKVFPFKVSSKIYSFNTYDFILILNNAMNICKLLSFHVYLCISLCLLFLCVVHAV